MNGFEWLDHVTRDPLIEQVVTKALSLPERSWRVTKTEYPRIYETKTPNGLLIRVEYKSNTGQFDGQYETSYSWTLYLDGKKEAEFWHLNDGREEGFTGVRLLFERVDRVLGPQIQAEAERQERLKQERKAAEEQRKRNDILKRL